MYRKINIYQDTNNLVTILNHILKDHNKKIIIFNLKNNYFNDTSWLWSINFQNLKNKKIKKIILYGKLKYDLYTRFIYSNINPDKIVIEKQFNKKLCKHLKNNINIYIITFNDINNIKNLMKKEEIIYEYKNCTFIL